MENEEWETEDEGCEMIDDDMMIGWLTLGLWRAA